MVRQRKKKSKATIKKPRDGTININIATPSTTRAPKSSVAPMRISGGRATGGSTGRAPNQAATLAAINELKNQIMVQALQQGTRQGITNKAEVEDLKKQLKELESQNRELNNRLETTIERALKTEQYAPIYKMNEDGEKRRVGIFNKEKLAEGRRRGAELRRQAEASQAEASQRPEISSSSEEPKVDNESFSF